MARSFLLLAATASCAFAQFAANSIVALRLGASGVGSAIPTTQAALFLDNFATTPGANVSIPLLSVAIPATGAGACTGTSAGTEGELGTDPTATNIYIACYALQAGAVFNYTGPGPRTVAIVNNAGTVSTSTQFLDVLNTGSGTNKHRNALSADGGASIYMVTHSGVYWLPGTGSLQSQVTLYAGNLLQGQVFDLGSGPQLFGMSATILYAFTPALAHSGTITTTTLVTSTGLVGFTFANTTTLWLLGTTLVKYTLTGSTWGVAPGYATPPTPLSTANLRGVITRIETPGGPYIAYVSGSSYIMRYNEGAATGTYASCGTACWSYIAAAQPGTILRGIQFAPAAAVTTVSATPAATATTSITATATATSSATGSPSPSAAVSSTGTPTNLLSPAATTSQTPSASGSLSNSAAATATPTASAAATATRTASVTASITPSGTPSNTPAPSALAPGTLVALRLGNGAVLAANTQAPLFLDAFLTSGATSTASVTATAPFTTVGLPVAGAGLCTGQNSGTEGELGTDLTSSNLYVACYPLPLGLVNNFSSVFPRSVAIVGPGAGAISTTTQFYDVLNTATNKHRSAVSADGGATIYMVTHSGVYWLPGTGSLQSQVTLYAGNLLQGQVFDLGSGPQLFGMSASALYAFTPALARNGTITTTTLVSSSGLVGFSFANATTLWMLSSTLAKYTLTGSTWGAAPGYSTFPTPPSATGLKGVITRVETPGGPWIAYVSSSPYVMRFDESLAAGLGVSVAACTSCWSYVATAPTNTIFRGIQFAPIVPSNTPTSTASPSATRTRTSTPSTSSTATPSRSATSTPSSSATSSASATNTGSASSTASETAASTVSSTRTQPATRTKTRTSSPSTSASITSSRCVSATR